jgi:putative transcriptional regulator
MTSGMITNPEGWKLNIMKNQVKKLRTKSGLTQEQLAAKLGVTRQTIISIEKGKYVPSLPLALRMGRVFEKKVEEVFEVREENNPT